MRATPFASRRAGEELEHFEQDSRPAAMQDRFLSVLILAPDPRVLGGITVFIETLRKYLPRCRVEWVRIGSLKDVGGFQAEKENPVALLGRLLLSPFRVVRMVHAHSFDVVHLNPALKADCLIREGFVLLALRLAGFRRVMVYFHGWDWKAERRLRRLPGLRHLFVRLLNGCSRVMVLAPAFKDALAAMGVDEERIVCTRTMFDGAHLRFGANRPPARRSILFMSRFVRAKGIYELLSAFALIAPEFPDADLVMAGDGEEYESLRRQARASGLEQRVVFPGYVGGREKAALLRNCTLFALPTYFDEGMPVAVLEAMGAGRPVLATRAGAIEDVLSAEGGIILEEVTAGSVAKALRRFLRDPQFCEKAGSHNRARAWEKFEAQIVTAEIEEIYRQIARLP